MPTSSPSSSLSPLETSMTQKKFVRVEGAQMRKLVEAFGSLADWDAFATSWDRLEPDTYMADGGRYRRRRHAVFSANDSGTIKREPHQAHFQTTDYNSLNGGVDRWFAAVEDSIAAGPACQALLAFSRRMFSDVAPGAAPWKIEMHQFRIEAKPGIAGKPTPEGMHRDGVDFVMVMMVRRTNIKSGETITTDANRNPLGQFTLTNAFDAVLLDDHHVYHGVTPVEAIDPARPAHRDVLVLTYRRNP